MLPYFKIKVWSTEESKWMQSYYYLKLPILPRTIGYMCQSDIENLPTKEEVINKIYRVKL